jgi:membrane protease YdiL (CAAX protease family)
VTELPQEVSRVVKGAGLVFPILAGLFWVATPLGLFDALYLTFLLELLPVMAVAQLPLVEEEGPLPRIPVYLSSGALILGVGWMAAVLGRRSLGDEAMGLGPAPWGAVVFWTLGLSLGALLLLGVFLLIRRKAGLGETSLLKELLPRTLSEKGIFAGLSLAAGLGEELAYRGYLIPVLTGLLGSVWGAAFLSSAVFGILHAYQGWLGVVRTGALGLMFAGSFLLSGTLWPAILAHAILDLSAGLVFGETLVKE